MLAKLTRIFKSDYGLWLIISLVGLVAWYPILHFWFLKAFEASWLHDALPYTLDRLIRTHAFIYYLDFRLFGWNPTGWYTTALILHLIASIVLFQLVVTLTKNRLIAFTAGLIFVANTAYNDVLTWGSFNSYYPLLLCWMLLTLLFFYRYKESGKRKYLVWSVIFSLLGFYTRETGVLIIPLITLFDILTTKAVWKVKNLRLVILRQLPYYGALIFFFVVRHYYGGTIGDTVDSNVKYQIRLVHDKLYREYTQVTLATFGKLIPPMLIPYPLLNVWRAKQMLAGNSDWLQVNFFPLLGYITYPLLGLLTLLNWRNPARRVYAFYFWLWLGAFAIFIALATPAVHEVLVRDYETITMRYRYFAFAGASVLYALSLVAIYDWLVKRKTIIAKGLFGLCLVLVVVSNLYLLRQIEKDIYQSTYKTEREFHLQFHKLFPTLPTNAAFYIYPHAPSLNDYLFEWYLTREDRYPNLIGQPYRIESQIEAVVEKVSKGKLKLDDFFFLDYDPSVGLIDRTDELRKLIKTNVSYPLIFTGNDKNWSAGLAGPPVELPYNLSLTETSSYSSSVSPGDQPDSRRFRALVDYSVDRKKFLDLAKLTTCRTISQRDDEPFYFHAPHHLIDGNTGLRSTWIADAVPAWVQTESANEQEVAAIAWGSIGGSSRLPASYHYAVSNDGSTWRDVKTVKNNAKAASVDLIEPPVRAKFVKMVIDTTASGDFAQLDEFEVITSKGLSAVKLYPDRDQLLEASRNIYKFMASSDDANYALQQGLSFVWAKLSWTVDSDADGPNLQSTYFAWPITASPLSLQVPVEEREIYADRNLFLGKHLTGFKLELMPGPYSTSIQSAQLAPRYKPLTKE